VLPLVDVAPLLADARDETAVLDVARWLDLACRRFGFVRIIGHGIATERREQLTELASTFFVLPDDIKAEIAMARGGSAWRGWFPAGGELTSGKPDGKEGIYFGDELGPEHPGVASGLPLHGANLFPVEPVRLGDAVFEWMASMTSLGLTVLRTLALGLGLDQHWFDEHITAHPTTLFRIFRYPPDFGGDDGWGVREHTDYGLPLDVLDNADVSSGARPRWDAADVHAWIGTYGDYLTAKVCRASSPSCPPTLPGDHVSPKGCRCAPRST